MGQICLRSEEPVPPPFDISTLIGEIERNHSILRLQESEVVQQSHKVAIMLQQVAVLIAEQTHIHDFPPSSPFLERVKQLKPALEQTEEDLSLAQDTVKGCKIECENIRMQLQTLQTKVENAIGIKESSEQVVEVETELLGVKGSLGGIHTSLARTHKQLRRMEDEITNARQLRQMQEAVHLQAVQQRTTQFENILRFPVYWIENKLMKSFLLWKAVTFNPNRREVLIHRPLQRTSARISNNYVTLTDMGDEEDEADFQISLNDEAHWLVETNPLNSTFLSQYLESATTLSKEELSEILSNFFAAKTEADEECCKNGVEPQLFPAFILSFYASKPNGYQKLGEIIRSVAYYLSVENKIGMLWSALLHLDAKTPALTQVSKNITRLLQPYRDCVEKCKLKHTGRLDDRLYIADAITLLNDTLARDPKTGKEVITLMKPPTVSDVDFTLFKLIHCMRQQSVDLLGLFRHVDRAGRGKVEIQQLAKGIKDCLGAWVPEGEIVSLLEQIDTLQSGEVTRLQFLDLNYKRFVDNQESEAYTVSLQSLLFCFVKAALSKAQSIIDQLKDRLQLADGDCLSREEFRVRIATIFPEYSYHNLEKMWSVALQLSGKATEVIQATIALRVLLRYPPSSFCDSVIYSNTLLDLRLQEA